VKEVLTEDEWRRLKGAYEDFTANVGATLGALFVRTSFVLTLAEAFAPDRVRELREALEYALQDTEDLFTSFDRKLNSLRPAR